MKSVLKLTLALSALLAAHMASAIDLTFQLSEVTAREWKIGEKQIMHLSKIETVDAPKLTVALAYYGYKPDETLCLDIYDYRPVSGSTNANMILLGHDIEEGKVVSVTATPRTNDTYAIITIVREKKTVAGKTVHNLYGYRVTAEGLVRTTDNVVWEPKESAKPAKKWFFFK
jgi:hypothetical protein